MSIDMDKYVFAYQKNAKTAFSWHSHSLKKAMQGMNSEIFQFKFLYKQKIVN